MDNNDPPKKKNIDDLLAVMAALRTPVTGCPWDLEQDFGSIAPFTLEETYEVLDAISRNDLVDLKEELGDLLLQVVYHARMAEEMGAFDFSHVADGITRKMIRRHPHVFGTSEERAAGPQKGSWDRIKAEERREKDAEKERLRQTRSMRSSNCADGVTAADGATVADSAGGSQLLGDIPVALPALVRAVKLQKKAAKAGFDWPSLGPVFEKMREELAELEDVALAADPRGDDDRDVRARVEEEFGDLLFVIANVARHLQIEPEGALRAANQKFIRRFGAIEKSLGAQGRTVFESDLEEMDALWDEAKQKEKSDG